MKVSLIDYTGYGSADPARHAANVLVFTKSTRLNMSPELMSEVERRPWSAIEDELKYMANTIPSSWEFVSYSFLITDVTRAFTHQFVRTRTASFAQQTMRVLDKQGWTYGTGPSIDDREIYDETDLADIQLGSTKYHYDKTMEIIGETYRWLIDNGAKIEDARGVLPTNIHTNIVAHFNLRTMTEMFRKRASGRTQGEYRDVADAMKDAMVAVHPWTTLFLNRTFDKAAAELESNLRKLSASGQQLDETSLTDLVKLIDQMRMTA